jgi:hypothetical protein
LRSVTGEEGGALEEFEKGPPIELTRAKAGLAKFLAYVARDTAEGLPKWKGFTLPTKTATT